MSTNDLTGQAVNWSAVADGALWALTVASFFIPGGAVVGAIVWGFRIARVVRAASAVARGVKGATTVISASRPTAAIAGRIYTRSWQVIGRGGYKHATNGSRWIQNGTRGYRSAAKKGRFGFSSNLTHSFKGRHDYRVLHVVHRSRLW